VSSYHDSKKEFLKKYIEEKEKVSRKSEMVAE